MSYIEREAAIEALEQNWNPDTEFEAVIGEIPAADVRPVVLFWDCQHWDTDYLPNPAWENEHFCPYIGLTTREDWFCGDGEKREEK